MSNIEMFTPAKKYNTSAFILMAVGVVSIIALYIATHGSAANEADAKVNDARFWASLLQNSVYFLLIVNVAMFFMMATTLAWGGWQLAFTRVTEAVSACVPVIGVIAGVVLLAVCFSDNHTIYHWADYEHVKHDKILLHKAGFLNKGFFAVFTILTIVLWAFLGWKMRKHSRSADENPPTTVEEKKSWIWKNTVNAALFAVVFALTALSTAPWLWLMSINAHWYSTMFSWYTFASSFAAGLSLIALYVVYLKNQGYLAIVTQEHLHDLGKFIFAFSIFWTYLWFSQFMLIWYANIPEETVYFQPRVFGVYHLPFWVMFIINFIAPLLIFMSRDSKRNYTVVTLVSLLVLFGHWLDFWQMVMPGIMPDKTPNILYDLGVAMFFVGIIMYFTGRTLSKYPLITKGHPFAKETVIHHT